ncbi:MAG: hypothetical protein AB1668_07280 [Nanoarchaeota archaeon]
MLRKNRKGVSLMTNMIVIIIILLVSAGVIAGLILLFKGPLEEKSLETACEASVIGRVKTEINLGITNFQWTPVNCKTIPKEVKGERKSVKEALARKAVRCWQMFYEGREEKVLGDYNCFVCYLIDTGEIEGGAIPKTELIDYLNETKYYKSADYTYLSYIKEHGGEGYALVLSDIKPKQLYGIAFLSKNGMYEFEGAIILFTKSLIIIDSLDSIEKSCTIEYIWEENIWEENK